MKTFLALLVLTMPVMAVEDVCDEETGNLGSCLEQLVKHNNKQQEEIQLLKLRNRLYLIEEGISTNKLGDKNSCQERGLKIFAPRTKQEYEVAREYLVSIGKPKAFGPLGVYHPNPTQVKYPWTSGTPMNSANAGAKFGWKSTAGDTWWISDKTDITEPNGDYTPNCWLSIQYDDSGNLSWYNDSMCGNSYTTYLCY